MTTLIPKFDFKNGGTTPAGAINRPINEKLEEVYSVKDFGAVGDGTTDDTAAINAVFAAASNAGYTTVTSKPSGKIIFPPGVYKITNQITLPQLINIIIEGQGSCSIVYGGTADGTKAMFRAQASATVSFDRCQMNNILLSANGLAGYCFVNGGSSGATYHSTWSFNNTTFSQATKIGVIIGSETGSIDIDSYQVNFWQCAWERSPIGVYVNAANAYGPLIERGYFADTFGPAPAGQVINHVRAAMPGDCRIYNTYFSALATNPATIDPITGSAVLDSNIYAVSFSEFGTISDCLTEECRFLQVLGTGQAYSQVTVSAIGTNDSRNADAQGRNLNWNLGTAAYSVYNAGNLAMYNCQFGSSNTDANGYRRFYNNSTLTIDEGAAYSSFLGVYGQMIHGTTSFIDYVNGTNTSTIPLTANWNFSKWQDANTLLDGITVSNGSSGVSTLDLSTSHTKYAPYTAKVAVTVASTTYASGLQIVSRPTAQKMTLVVVGYATTFNGLNCFKNSVGMTPIGTSDGNLFFIYNADTSQFVGSVTYDVNLTYSNDIFGCIVGLPTGQTGTYYYQVLGFIPGKWDIADITAMLPFLGTNNTPLNGKNEQHFGTAAPTAGLWYQGDVVWNSAAASGSQAGWMCVSGNGTSAGTWKAMANLA